MDGPDRTALDPLIATLSSQAPALDFFTVMRRLECADRALPRWGMSRRPADDPVRLSHHASLLFSPAEIASFRPRQGRTPMMRVNFLGLLSTNGPLPLHLCEYLLTQRRDHQDNALADFLDLLQHRLISLYYRAWASANPAVSLDRQGEAADRFSRQLASLCGVASGSCFDRDVVSPMPKLAFAGRFAMATRNAEGLTAILSHDFNCPITLEQFTPRWLVLPPQSQCRLGGQHEGGALGQSTILGTRILDVQQAFTLRLGPMDWTQYSRLLPGAAGQQRLIAWVDSYTCREWTCRVRLVLSADEVRPMRLGDPATRLGYSCWLGHRAPRDREDLEFDYAHRPPRNTSHA